MKNFITAALVCVALLALAAQASAGSPNKEEMVPVSGLQMPQELQPTSGVITRTPRTPGEQSTSPSPSSGSLAAEIRELTGVVRQANTRLDNHEERLTTLEGQMEQFEGRQEKSIARLDELEQNSLARREQMLAAQGELQAVKDRLVTTEQHAADLQVKTQQLQGEVNRAWGAYHHANNAAKPKGIGKLIGFLIPPLRHQN